MAKEKSTAISLRVWAENWKQIAGMKNRNGYINRAIARMLEEDNRGGAAAASECTGEDGGGR